MNKVLIVGAGAQGGPCASILSRDDDVSEIILGDIDLDLAKKVKEKIKSDKITAVRLDAGKIDDIEQAANIVAENFGMPTHLHLGIRALSDLSQAFYAKGRFGYPANGNTTAGREERRRRHLPRPSGPQIPRGS